MVHNHIKVNSQTILTHDQNLAQINLYMFMGETSRLPIYQTVYSGSLKDVSTLKTILAKFETIAGDKPVLVVMDKRVCQ